MQTKPSKAFKKILICKNKIFFNIKILLLLLENFIINNIILDIHPFGIINVLNKFYIPAILIKKCQIFYTIHGETSLLTKNEYNFFKQKGQNIKIYSVSQKLIDITKATYPKLMNELILFKNNYTIADSVKIYPVITQKNIKTILFSTTNILPILSTKLIKICLQLGYNVICIGVKIPQITHSRLTQLGFIDIVEFYNTHSIDIVFGRGGYAIIDCLARNIAAISYDIRKIDNNIVYYINDINRDNYKYHSDNNFISWDIANNLEDILKEHFLNIEKNYKYYQCSNLVNKFNLYDNE